MGGAVGGGTAGLVGGGLAGGAIGYSLPDWFSKAQKARKLNKILAALGGGAQLCRCGSGCRYAWRQLAGRPRYGRNLEAVTCRYQVKKDA